MQQQQQHQKEKNNSNLPTSLVNAFSSLSSFTSNFNIGTNDISNNDSSLTIETASTSTRLSQITSETREDILIRKASLERKNLINLTKLIVKDLISFSLTAGRTIDDCQNAVHLNNYFTLIDRVLKHGLKQNLLTNKSANLWAALDSLPNYLKESTLMSESVRSLAHTKSADGKIKAWMRLAMMQKKLPEYFDLLLANKDLLLKNIYHDYAFMLNDEAQVFAGLIIGVNVIDCNFFVKNANFDLIDDIIDLSPYLRAANSFDEDDQIGGPNGDNTNHSDELLADKDQLEKLDGPQRLTMILDQKSYLEERNAVLESTISDLRVKVKNLEDQCSRLEMEAKVSEVRIQNLLTNTKETATTPTPPSPPPPPAPPSPPTAAQESKKSGQVEPDTTNKTDEILQERVTILETNYQGALEKIKVLEHDSEVLTSMNSDKENTIKIYEKDIRDLQAQIKSLRTSLNETKKMNTELNERFNDVSAKLKDRITSVSNLQTTLDKWKLENKNLAARLQDKQTAFKSLNGELKTCQETIKNLKEYNEKINDVLKKERECGQSSSVTVEAQNVQIIELKEKLEKYDTELEHLRPFKQQVEQFEQKCKDLEQSLEEIGYQLRESRLEVESLKENSSVFLDSQWMDSRNIKNCALCEQPFSVTRRKHHCRLCGNVFCQTCSDNKMELASSAKPARVCDTCHAFLLAKFVKTSTNG